MKPPTFDKDGCITDETYEEIKNCKQDPALWLEYVEACWDTRYGKVEHKAGEIHFITGGWSANECIQSAMGENMLMHAMMWLSSHRGGLTVYQVPETEV